MNYIQTQVVVGPLLDDAMLATWLSVIHAVSSVSMQPCNTPDDQTMGGTLAEAWKMITNMSRMEVEQSYSTEYRVIWASLLQWFGLLLYSTYFIY